jgi:hypothetical protein
MTMFGANDLTIKRFPLFRGNAGYLQVNHDRVVRADCGEAPPDRGKGVDILWRMRQNEKGGHNHHQRASRARGRGGCCWIAVGLHKARNVRGGRAGRHNHPALRRRGRERDRRGARGKEGVGGAQSLRDARSDAARAQWQW